jgi:hypothetical protein
LSIGRNQRKLLPLASKYLNSHRYDNPHRTGSQGCAKKVPKWAKKLQELVQKGGTPQTIGWDARSLRYLLARKMTYNDDGSLGFPNDAVRQLAERIPSTIGSSGKWYFHS